MTPDALVYIVDDDKDLREAVLDTLEQEKLPACGFAKASEALKVLDPEWPGVIVSDIRMPGMSGLEFLEAAKQLAPQAPFILITGHGDIETAIFAIKSGAYDFLEKPTRPEHLVCVVRRALEMRRLELDNAALAQKVAEGGNLKAKLIGRSKAIRTIRKDLLAIAPLSVDVLVRGETGTGKELVARCLHDFSPRADKDFVAVNCGSLSASNLDEILFSPEGRIAEAAGGTLFLDEMDSLPEPLQVRFLRFLENRSSDPSAPRVIAALKADPESLIEQGKLRADLYYRINVAQLYLPPLRERDNDVFVLLEYFLRAAAVRHNLKVPHIGTADLPRYKSYDWPGNVREVRNVAEKLVIGLTVHLTSAPERGESIGKGYDAAMDRFEADLLRNALLQAGGRKGEAAELLGIPRKRLYLRLKQHGLD